METANEHERAFDHGSASDMADLASELHRVWYLGPKAVATLVTAAMRRGLVPGNRNLKVALRICQIAKGPEAGARRFVEELQTTPTRDDAFYSVLDHISKGHCPRDRSAAGGCTATDVEFLVATAKQVGWSCPPAKDLQAEDGGVVPGSPGR